MTVHDIKKGIHSDTTRMNQETVLAFHCSGGSTSQYQVLKSLLGQRFQLATPEYYGKSKKGHWHGKRDFSLSDEAFRTIRTMDAGISESYHLVGHSYGGAVALHIARARPKLVRSLTLYEPCVFNLLEYAGTKGYQALQEISTIAERVTDAIVRGNTWKSMQIFVDYWNTEGTWAALSSKQQNQLMRWAPKLTLEFSAMLNEKTPLESLDSLTVPTKIILGEHAPYSTRISSLFLALMLGDAHTYTLNGAGHMGPLTHPVQVANLMKIHIEDSMDIPEPDQTQVTHESDFGYLGSDIHSADECIVGVA